MAYVYGPYTPPEDKTKRILLSGSAYRATPRGWIRLNHPKNKHQRRHEALHGRAVPPHRPA